MDESDFELAGHRTRVPDLNRNLLPEQQAVNDGHPSKPDTMERKPSGCGKRKP